MKNKRKSIPVLLTLMTLGGLLYLLYPSMSAKISSDPGPEYYKKQEIREKAGKILQARIDQAKQKQKLYDDHEEAQELIEKASLNDEEWQEKRRIAIKKHGFYHLSSPCEEQINDWTEDEPLPDCVINRFNEIYDPESAAHVKRRILSALCSAEYEYARKQLNYEFGVFAGSKACKKTPEAKNAELAKRRKMPTLSTLPTMEDWQEREDCLAELDKWEVIDPIPKCIIKHIVPQMQKTKEARKR